MNLHDCYIIWISLNYLPNIIPVLDAFIETLDKRHDKSRGSCWVEGKRRVMGSPSRRLPPEGCPGHFIKSSIPVSMPIKGGAHESEGEEDFDPDTYVHVTDR